MKYSPKLKKAMEEIKHVLSKHDIAAAVVLHTPGYSEFLLELQPSYSCVRLLPSGDGVRFRAHKSDYNGDEKKRDEVATDTLNMLSCLGDTMGRVALQIIDASEQLDEIAGATHTNQKFTSHNTQNN